MVRGIRTLAALALGAAAATGCSSPSPSPTLGPAMSVGAAPTVSTTQPSVPTTAPASSERLIAAACAGRMRIETTGQLTTDLDEISGIVASRRHSGILWVSEDSGNPSAVTAVGLDGSKRATLRLAGSPNLDWEAMALAPGPNGRDYIYVGDIGDNFRIRGTVSIYRFAEPETLADATIASSAIERIEGRYTTGSADAEAMFVDDRGTIWIIAKVTSGAALMFSLDRASGELRPTGDPFNLGSEAITGADLSPDGRALIVRTYETARLFVLGAGPGARERFCRLPTPPDLNGEAVAVLADGNGVAMISEVTPGGERAAIRILTYDR